jgi:hypothetical protein
VMLDSQSLLLNGEGIFRQNVRNDVAEHLFQ